jgi:hypothetical protein
MIVVSIGTAGSDSDLWTLKLDSTGTKKIFGGRWQLTKWLDVAYAVAVDSKDQIYLAGETQPLSSTNSDAFVMKVDGSGNIGATKLFGGAKFDEIKKLVPASGGGLFVVGNTQSADLPIVNGFQKSLLGSEAAFVGKIDQDLTAFSFLSYLGGSGKDSAAGVGIDSTGGVIVTGTTGSDDFPQPAGQSTVRSGPSDAFIARDDRLWWTGRRNRGWLCNRQYREHSRRGNEFVNAVSRAQPTPIRRRC